ncbi:MAG: DUF3574 domain-containing protein [Lachnospiraceae bacterium]|nr:DUF3574 domain-containing protein [Lachnospiraceae bacterium]
MELREGRKGYKAVILLLVINFLMSVGIIGFLAIQYTDRRQVGQEPRAKGSMLTEQMEMGKKYVLYIGTNDKDSYKQVISTEEAREMVNEICIKYVDGYTASEAKGGWVDETDTLTQENTLVYAFYEVTEEQLVNIMEEILEALNQNAILVEKQEAIYTYYSGK